MTATAAELVYDSRCDLGESCVWDEANDRVLFCDIPTGRIHAYGIADGATQIWQLPEPVGSFGLCRSGRLVVALLHSLVLFEPRSGTVTSLAGPVEESASHRFNDGKVGPDGCFWVGSMDRATPRGPTGALYRVRPDGVIERKLEGVRISNGLAWSPDGTVMYHSDSDVRRIDAWRFDPATGAIDQRRSFAMLTREQGLPDGAATDVEGCYWSAGVTAGCLNRFAPDGTWLDRIALPVPTPTMPCFAGAALFVTSLRRAGMVLSAAQVEPGGLLRLPAPVGGVKVGLFADR